AYAELTCPAPAPVSERRPAERSQAVSGRRRSTSRTRDARALKSGSITLPRGFTPLGETARFLGSYVAGHRRQLPLDWTHSDEAAANAAKYGIRLADHETWVEPH